MGTREVRLNEAMEDRRLSLDLEWRDVADTANVSYETLRALRRTGQASSLTKRRTEEALQWEPGSIDEVLSGGEPTPVGQPEPSFPELDKDQLREILRRSREVTTDLERLLGDNS